MPCPRGGRYRTSAELCARELTRKRISPGLPARLKVPRYFNDAGHRLSGGHSLVCKFGDRAHVVRQEHATEPRCQIQNFWIVRA